MKKAIGTIVIRTGQSMDSVRASIFGVENFSMGALTWHINDHVAKGKLMGRNGKGKAIEIGVDYQVLGALIEQYAANYPASYIWERVKQIRRKAKKG